MRRLRLASEDEMVLCFLRAERASPRWGDALARHIEGRWNLLDQPNLRDDVENQARSRVLRGYRRYRRNVALFQGFHDDTEWWFERFTRSEVGDFLFALGVCDELTKNTRRVSIAAKNAATIPCQDGSLNEGIAEVIRADLNAASFSRSRASAASARRPTASRMRLKSSSVISPGAYASVQLKQPRLGRA